MHKKKIALLTMAAVISNSSASVVEVLASELQHQATNIQLDEAVVSTTMPAITINPPIGTVESDNYTEATI